MKTRLRWLAALATLSLLAGACADGEDTEEASTDTSEAEGTESETEDAASEPAADFEPLLFETDQCGAETYTGNLQKIEAADAQTVTFTLCEPDVAFPSKVAFSAFGILPSEYIEETGGGLPLSEAPIGTGPYQLQEWDRGNQLILEKYEDYWGEPAKSDTVVFRWSAEAAQRLVELQSGTVDGIDNVGTEDFETVANDDDLQLLERDPLNVFYVGFNVDKAPFDNELVRQAVAAAIDKERIVENFYPAGSQPAEQFLPDAIPGAVEGFDANPYDPDRARELLAEAGMPDGFDVTLSLRDVVRGYLPNPVPVATDIQAQLAEVGINVTIDVQESGTFIDNANAGNLPFYLLGWGADYPDATNFLDFHFGAGSSPQFGTGFSDIQSVLSEAASLTDQDARDELYAEAADLIAEHSPMVPVAHGGSAVAFKADAEGAHASPLSNENLSVVGIEGQDTLVWLQNAEPIGLYCADETDGESLRACEQIVESLLAYEVGGVEVVPSLAEEHESNEELTEWTFTLREGVTFHDGSELDANDVVKSYQVQWDAADPLHVGRVGDFTYFSALFGGFLNAPPAEE
ncbi:MAG: ABC transporter substrate-binding protein [Actinomycetota bacterium]|nr:ABC transporter substrate-binding protein [Actinomycetota bacterium]